MFANMVLGFCWLELPALIVLVGVVVFSLVKRRGMRKEEKELEEQLEALRTPKKGVQADTIVTQ